MLNISTLIFGAAALPAAALLLPVAAAPAPATAPAQSGGYTYEVTITNLTANQVFSPPVIASHNDAARMFVPGDPATPELAALAEDGMTAGLVALLAGNPDVLDVQTFAAGIPPGTSATMTLQFDGMHQNFSVASMLVTTNDGFMGLDSVEGMARRRAVLYAPVWDAGSEFNSEDCMYIPGPPCGSAGMHDPTPAEGYVHMHSGIHGGGSLDPATDDWGAFAARIEVVRL